MSMKVELLKNSGYCFGVKNAIDIAINARKKYPNKKIYVLGMLIHNNYVVDILNKYGIETLDVSLNEYQEAIKNLECGSVIIFSAHGHDINLDKIVEEKKLIKIDAICPMVQQCMKLILNALNKNQKIIYIGIKNHPETNAMLSINKDIIFIDYKLPIYNQINTNDSYFCINQTTLSFIDLYKIHDDLKRITNKITIADEICKFTRNRQEEILNLPKNVDGIVVVGSKKSSNTMRLYEMCLNKYSDCTILFVQDEKEVNLDKLKNLHHIIVLGGTSCHINQLENIKNFILNNVR